VGKRGPPRTPTPLLELRGSWRAGTRKGEPRPRRSRPRPPDWLSDDAKAVFVVLVRHLFPLGVVARLDEGALGRYADLFVQYRKASEWVTKHGDVYVVPGQTGKDGKAGPASFRTYPQAYRALALANELLRLEREFGLTSAARARLVTETPAPAEPSYDYFRSAEGVG
jgi:P27 family predicted phage terminase small subunit